MWQKMLQVGSGGGGSNANIVIDAQEWKRSVSTYSFTYDKSKNYFISAGFVGELGSSYTRYFSTIRINNNVIEEVEKYSYVPISVDTTNHVITINGTYSGHIWGITILHTE